jgi:trigger factor
MSDQRPPIPDPIKREVRQRCSFGCVICGLPLYEYHHIVPYAECPEHKADNLTLLCDKHHREYESKLLPHEKLIEANNAPLNRIAGISFPYGLHYGGKHRVCTAVVGGNQFEGVIAPNGSVVLVPIAVDDIDLIAFEVDSDGELFVHMTFFDENNEPLLVVRKNELVYSTDQWDIEFVGQVLTLRERAREISLKLRFQPPNGITVESGRLLCNGVQLLVTSESVYVAGGGGLGRNQVQSNFVGYAFGRCDRPAAIRCGPILRNYKPRDEAVRDMRKWQSETAKLLDELAKQFPQMPVPFDGTDSQKAT